MSQFIYNAHGTVLGFIHDKYIHDLHGHPLAQIHGTHVHKLSGAYIGELHADMIVKMHLDNYGSLGNAGIVEVVVPPDHPSHRGPVSCGYPDASDDLFR